MPPNGCRAGEHQVVKWRRREQSTLRSFTLHDRYFTRVKCLGKQPSEQRRGPRREFRRFDDRAVSRGENACKRREDAHDRVIPRTDDPNHAEGNVFHARLRVRRERGMVRGLHPVFDLRCSMAECIHGTVSLEFGLLGAAMAEVLGQGDTDSVTAPREHRRCARQTIPARRRIGNALLCMRSALKLYEAVELALEDDGDHLASPFTALSWIPRVKSVDKDTARQSSSSRS